MRNPFNRARKIDMTPTPSDLENFRQHCEAVYEDLVARRFDDSVTESDREWMTRVQIRCKP